MILTVIRNIDEDFKKTNVLICNDEDFETALAIVRKTIDYSLVVSKLLSRNVNTDKDKLNSREITLLGHLNGEFTRTNALEIAERLKIPERTLGHILKKLVKYDFIERVSQGKYKKM
ncbi:MAG: helix-turn-helix transcriptional regulator [Flavobacteriaceae bacterium]|nr:helix-turn-helix transcriptional regulator [Flavobacteriaceae bacterium]